MVVIATPALRDMVKRITGPTRICDEIILTTGQWDGGWPMQIATPLREFRDELAASVRLLRQMLIPDTGLPVAGLSLMTTNYNPAGCLISACPPTDWRAPPVIGAYNDEVRKLAYVDGLRLIDLEPYIGAMWDASPDWCHPDAKVLEREATALLEATEQPPGGVPGLRAEYAKLEEQLAASQERERALELKIRATNFLP